MKSNINYFLKQSIRLLLISIAYSAFLAFVTYDTGEGLSQIVGMFIFGAAIMNISMHIAMYKRDISLVISFGSTRKNLMRGLLFYELFSLLLIDLVAILFAFIFDKTMPIGGVCLITTIIMLLTGAIGNFMGIIFEKFGKVTGVIIMLVLLFAVGVGAGIMSALISDKGYVWAFLESGRNVIFLVSAIVVAVWVAVQYAQSRILRKYAV